MLHNLFIWFVIILVHKIITGHIWKVPAPLHFWEYSPSLAFGERWKQNAWLWTQMSICFPSKSTATTTNAKKSTTTTRRKFIIGAIGVIRTFGQCPLQPRFFLMDLSPWHSVMVLTPKVPFDKWQYVGERAVFPLWLVFAPLFRNWIKVSRIRPVSHIGPPNNKLKMQNLKCVQYYCHPWKWKIQGATLPSI